MQWLCRWRFRCTWLLVVTSYPIVAYGLEQSRILFVCGILEGVVLAASDLCQPSRYKTHSLLTCFAISLEIYLLLCWFLCLYLKLPFIGSHEGMGSLVVEYPLLYRRWGCMNTIVAVRLSRLSLANLLLRWSVLTMQLHTSHCFVRCRIP